jgi:uncharacterized membrane protein YeaQ/YmgE (transglycosylase-associated protein family)
MRWLCAEPTIGATAPAGAWFGAQQLRASCHPPQRGLHTSCRRHSVSDDLAVHVVSRTDHALRRRNHRSSGRGHPARDVTQHIGENGMNFIIWLTVGGLIGWIASILMKANDQQGMFLNIIVGVVGAMLGGWLISPMVGAGTINQDNFSLPALFVSLVGAVILLAVMNMFRRGAVR